MSDATRSASSVCPLCSGRPAGIRFPYATRWNGKRFDYVACDDCSATFVAPMPSDADFTAMYSQESYHDLHYTEEVDSTDDGVVAEVAAFLKPGGRLLDYGCGNGAFLKATARAGYESEGIELDAATRERAEALSGRPIRSLDEALAAGVRYDAIHMSDVLEHLPAPADTLHVLDELLAPDGVYFIEGPLEDNPGAVLFASRLFGGIKRRAKPESAVGDFPPYHLTRVSARQQRRFFERAGYAVLLFATREDGWPYRSTGPASQGKAARVRNMIADCAIVTAGLGKRLGADLGNRFVAIIRPAAARTRASPPDGAR